jgi:hypothetical protein
MGQVNELVGKACFEHLFLDLDGRQIDRLVSQAEGAPVQDQQVSGAEFPEGLDRFGWIHVTGFHEPAWFIGAHVDDGQVDVVHLADFPESVEVGGVAGDINGLASGRPDQIRTPQRPIRAGQRAAHGPVVAGQEGNPSLTMAEIVQPIQSGHGPGGELVDDFVIAEGNDETGVTGQGFESGEVQMVEMIVGNQDEVRLGHVVGVEVKGRVVLDKKGQAVEHRINQDAALPVLDQYAGMVDKSDTQPLVVLDRLPIERNGGDRLPIILIPEMISGQKLPLENVHQAAMRYMTEGIDKTTIAMMAFLRNDFFQVHLGKINPPLFLVTKEIYFLKKGWDGFNNHVKLFQNLFDHSFGKFEPLFVSRNYQELAVGVHASTIRTQTDQQIHAGVGQMIRV